MTEANVHWQIELNTASRLRREDSRAAQAAVQEALRLTGYRELRCLQVECSDNAVTISGRVPTYSLNVPSKRCRVLIASTTRFTSVERACGHQRLRW